MRETRTVITTRCDRPRCNRVISEDEQEEGAPPDEKEPDFLLERAGKPAIKYHDLCDICTKAVDNYVLGIEKKSTTKKKAEPEPVAEPADPGALRWESGISAWLVGEWGEGDSRVGTRNYSHVEVNERTTVIPELEGVTDLEEARGLIEAAGAGEQSDR